MAGVTTDRLRNVVLLSHTGAGKTMLAEAMLHGGGRIHPAGLRRGRHDRFGLRA